ncbi:MAG: MOSC domain-containing protein [Acidimicrobiales bacterium]
MSPVGQVAELWRYPVKSTSGGRPEEAWLGHTLRIGGVTVVIGQRTERCVMTTMAQEGLPFVPAILRELEARAASRLGVYARVETEGCIRVGDDVTLVS